MQRGGIFRNSMRLFFNFSALLAVSATAGLYWLGVEEGYFWIYDWWDTLLHLLGGLTVGLWCGAVAVALRMPALRAFLFTFGAILAVAVAWEVWEYATGLTGGTPGYWEDTTKDIINGCIGAVAAWALYGLFGTRTLHT